MSYDGLQLGRGIIRGGAMTKIYIRAVNCEMINRYHFITRHIQRAQPWKTLGSRVARIRREKSTRQTHSYLKSSKERPI